MFTVISSGSTTYMCANLFLLGVFLLPIIGHGYSYAAEVALPVNESLACGLMLIMGSVVSSVVSFGVAS